VTGGALRPGDPAYLGGYWIERRLGEGGQGVVYQGVAHTGRKVAIKVLRSRLLVNDSSALSREITAARQVAEFCTAAILDVALDHDPPYIVSEYVDGPTLQQVIAAEGVRTGAALHRLAVATITALAAIHRAGVVHRDFKPGNVLLAPDGPRVIDFGIARLVDLTTTTGTTAGSPPYMAPDHFTGARIGPEADIFAWGSTMVFAATGRPPFGDDNIAAVSYRILSAEPDLSAIPEPLRDVVRRCLAKDPAQRPTANEVLLRLLNRSDPSPAEALEQGRAVARGVAAVDVGDGPTTLPSLPRRKVLTGVGTMTAALAASGAMLWYRLTSDDTPATLAAEAPSSATPTATRAAASGAFPPPDNPQELAAAIDAALAVTPSATFEFDGGFTQSDWSVSAEGRLYHDSVERRETAFDMVIHYPPAEQDLGPEQMIIANGAGYALQRRNAKFTLDPEEKKLPSYARAAHMVVAMSSIQAILELLLATNRVRRKDRTYTGGVPVREDTHELVVRYLRDWGGASGYVNYRLTVDEHDLPKQWRVGWRMPYGDGSVLESFFTTRYREWRGDRKISPPR